MSSNLSNSNCALVKNWCNTEIEVHEVDFDWTIRNFHFHVAKGDNLRSSIFSATTSDRLKWYLLCKPNGENEDNDSIALSLYLSTDVLESVFAEVTTDILGFQGKSKIIEFCAPKWCRTWPKFLKKELNFRKRLSENDNNLTIHLGIKFSEMKKVHNSSQQSKPKISASSLSEDLAILFENHVFSDVILSVKGRNYPAHKNILAARSPVFAAMFRHNMKETEQSRVVIEDVNEDVMGEILRYIYTGKCENLGKYAEELLEAADKYALDILKMMCIEELPKTLSVENAAYMLELADLHNADELKVEVMKVIVAKFTEVSNTTGWKNMSSNARLVGEVCQAFARR